MLNKLLAGTAAIAVLGLAGSAMAGQTDAQNYQVDVNIEVAEEVSMWAADENVALLLEGNDGNNFDGVASQITHINNVAANIDVAVTGDLPGTNTTSDANGDGVWFYIFDNVDVATAQANMMASAYAPAGALVWSNANENTSQNFASGLPIATTAVNRNITYAAATPGELPEPTNIDLDVVWTISPDS